MTAHELLRNTFDDAGHQLDKSLDGFPEEALDVTPAGFTMSPRETLAHLCEAYTATIAQMKGEKYEWGSYRMPDCATTAVLDTFHKLRAEATEAILAGDDDALKAGIMFITAHDYYHVGQLCIARLAAQPDWNPYAIYE